VAFARPPMVGVDDRCFWDGVAAGQLLLQRCTDCGEMRHPPRPMCPHCTSLHWETFAASGRGKLHSYVIPHAPVPPGFDEGYVVALIELEEGARLVSNLTGVAHDEIRNDMPVGVVFEPVEGGLLMHRFRPT
jgi:uncharacterized OB-fold protein